MTSRLRALFALNRDAFRPARGIVIVGGMLVPLVVCVLVGESQYALSMGFGGLFVALSDPGGRYAIRLRGMALVAAIGIVLTAVGFAIGDEAWGLVVVAVFVVTLLAGLAVKYGAHRAFAGLLLNIWFLIALALPINYQLEGKSSSVSGQTLAWAIGAGFWIALTLIVWTLRGRRAQPTWFPEFSTDMSTVPLTRPMILFTVIRASAVAGAAAIAYGLHLPNADWMPIATLVAMKPDLNQAEFVAAQRLAGAILGSTIAAVTLVTLHDKTALAVVLLVLAAIAASIRSVNYAFYTAAVAAVVLIGIDIPNPSDLDAEVRRVVFTFIGLGIAIVVDLLATWIRTRSSPTGAK